MSISGASVRQALVTAVSVPRSPTTPSTRALVVASALSDLVALTAAAAAATEELPLARHWTPVVFVALAMAIQSLQGRRPRITWSLGREARTALVPVSLAFAALLVGGGFGGRPASTAVIIPLAVGAVVAERGIVHMAVRRARVHGSLAEPTLIVGAGGVALRFCRVLDEHPEYGLAPVGFVDDIDQVETEQFPYPLVGRPGDLAVLLDRYGVRRVIVAFGVARETAMLDVIRACDDASVNIHVLPRFFELGFSPRGADVDWLWGFPIVRLSRSVLRRAPRLAKRALDVAVAGPLLMLLAPLYAVVALAVKLSSPGPVHFRQSRVAEAGITVEVLKFRSMRSNDDGDTQWTPAGDSRVTRVGSFLRSSSIDEIPQLWNVLRGDMSLVGPRPERPVFVEEFGRRIPRYGHRHRMPAGLTGLSQVNGLRGDTSIDDRAWLDNQYIENWSIGLDIAILGRTFGAVLRDALGVEPPVTATASATAGGPAPEKVLVPAPAPETGMPAAGAPAPTYPHDTVPALAAVPALPPGVGPAGASTGPRRGAMARAGRNLLVGRRGIDRPDRGPRRGPWRPVMEHVGRSGT